MSRLVYLSVLMLSLCGLPGVSRAQAATDSLASRMQNMERLLNESSGARQIADSGDSAAIAKREQALELYRQAREKLNEGSREEAVSLLDASTRLMFEAIRNATPVSLQQDKQKVDYGARMESVVALREAFNRIADETGDDESRRQVNRQLAELIDRADAFLSRGDNTGAQAELDKAYHLLKVSIEAKRSGQTLVRSLQFKSKKEEYLYEVDRNDTHRMLVGLLVDEKAKSDYTRNEIARFLEQASQLREQADTYAAQQEFGVAIDLLEQSTRQLVRAIRTAGIYIPG